MFISYETHQGFKSVVSSAVKVVSYLLLFIVLFATGKSKRKNRTKLRFYPIVQIPGNSVIITTRFQFKETFPIFLQSLVVHVNIVIRHFLFMWNLVVFKLRKLAS